MINLGSTPISRIYVGSDEVSKVFLGDKQVYPNYTLSLSFNEMEFEASGQAKDLGISVSEGQSWELTIPDGFEASKLNGVGSDTIQISVSNNMSETPVVGDLKVVSEGLEASCTLSQAAGSKEYLDPEISLSYSDIPAGGGVVYPVLSYSQLWTWNGVSGSGGTITSGGSVTYSGSVVSSSDGSVSAVSKETVESGRTKVTTSHVTVSLNGKVGESSFDVYQQENVPTLTGISADTLSYDAIPVLGGSSSPYYSISGSYSYTSGSTSTSVIDSVVRSRMRAATATTKSFAFVAPVAGFTIDSGTGVVSAAETEQTSEKVAQVKMSVEYEGFSSSVTGTCLQPAGSVVYGTPTVALSYATASAAGGILSPVFSVTQPWGWNNDTDAGVLSYDLESLPDGSSVNFTTTAGTVGSGDGSIAVPTKGTTESGVTTYATITCAVTVNGVSGSGTAAVSQAANTKALTGVSIERNGSGDLVTSFTAAGGTAYYKPVGVYTYTSTSTQTIELDSEVTEDNWSLDQAWGSVAANPTYPWCSVVTINSRGTVIGNSRSAVLKLTVGGLSDSVVLTQEANSRTLNSIRIDKHQFDDSWVGIDQWGNLLPAGGEALGILGYRVYDYTSGSSSESRIIGESPIVNIDVDWVKTYLTTVAEGCVQTATRGNQIGNARSGNVSWTVDGLTSNSLSFTQAENTITSVEILNAEDASAPVISIPASKSVYGYTLRCYYSSGSTGSSVLPQSIIDWSFDQTWGSLRDNEGSDRYYTYVEFSSRVTTIGSERSGSLICTINGAVNDVSINKTASLTITQAGNYIEVINLSGGSLSYPIISAGATSATPSVVPVSVSYTYTSGGTATSSPGAEFGVYSASVSFSLGSVQNGFTAVNAQTGVLTATNRGTEIGNNRMSGVVTRKVVCTWTPTDEYNSSGIISATKNITATCTQVGNYVVDLLFSGGTFNYPNISASATSASPGIVVDKTITYKFSSGATSTTMPSSTYGSLSRNITCSLGSVQNGFTAVNPQTGVLTATNRGTEIGNARTSGIVTRTTVCTWKHTTNYGTGGTVTRTTTQTATCTQVANTLTWNTPTISRTTPVSMPVGGGTNNVATGLTYSQTGQYSSGSPASASSGGSLSYSVVTAKTGFSLAGSIVTVTNNTSTSARNGFVVRITLKLNDKTATKDITYNQIAGYYTYANPVVLVSYSTIPASGGTVTPTVSYSQTYGWNGATSGAGTKTSGGSVSYSGTSVNTSNGSVTAGSKGTTVSGVTTVTDDATVTVDMNGKRGTKTVAVQQAANAVVDSNHNPRITAYGTPAVSIGSGMTAAGGSATVSHSVTNTQTYNALYTSGATGPNQTRSVAGTTTISITSNGNNAFSLSGNTLSHRDMATTLATDSVTITAKNSGDTSKTKTASTSITNSRQATGSSGGVTTYGNVVAGTITNKTIPASGGSATATAGNGSQSWSKTAVVTTYTYTSGDTKQETTTAVSSGNNIIAPSISSITANASSKGQTVSGQTTVKTQAVTWSGSASKSASGTMYIYQAANSLKSYSNILINQFSYNNIPYSGGTSSPAMDITYDVTYDSGTYRDEHGLPSGYSITYATSGSWFNLNASTGVITAPNNTTADIKSVIVTAKLSRNSDHVVITSAQTTVKQDAKPGLVDIYITTSFDYASSQIKINFSTGPKDTFFIKFMGYDQSGGLWEYTTGIMPSSSTTILFSPPGYSITDQFSIEGLGATEYTISPSSPYKTSNARYYWQSTFKS